MKRRPASVLAVLVAALAWACSLPPEGTSDEKQPSIDEHAIDALPSDIENRTLVDFGGKVHLVGWELSPKGRATPGSTLSLRLYWRSLKKLGPGYRLYTHLTADDGTVYEFDREGPLRAAPLSAWIPGTLYRDEQSIVVPNDVSSRNLTLSVGVKHVAMQSEDGEPSPEFRLEVLSGVSDGDEGALLARLATGVRRRARAAKEPRRPVGSRAQDERGGDRPGSARARDEKAPSGRVRADEKLD